MALAGISRYDAVRIPTKCLDHDLRFAFAFAEPSAGLDCRLR
jgi:hypothetical protein